MRALPEGWVEVELGDVIESKETRNPRTDGSKSFRYIDIQAVDNDRNRINVAQELASRMAPSRARRLVRQGDVLFCLVRPYLRNIARVPPALDGQVASTAFCVLRPSGAMASRFLFHQVLRDSFIGEVPTYGTSPPSAREDEFLKQPIPLAPLPEQRRIVGRIESLGAKLDEGVAALKRAEANLERYRASVLKAAVEGRLTERWRRENPPVETGHELLRRILTERRKRWKEEQLAKFAATGRRPPRNWKAKYKEPVRPDTSGLPELPEAWSWATVDQVARVTGGLTKNPARSRLPVTYPYLRVANVYADEVRLDDVRTIGVSETELDRVVLRRGDLLVVEGNGSADQIGRVAEWRGGVEPCCHQNHLIKVRCAPSTYMPRWLLLWLLSPAGREAVLEKASSTSGLHTLSLSKVRAIPIPVAPIAEQSEAVRATDRLRDIAQAVHQQVEAEIVTRAPSLRQSILERAFEGGLVPQDPDDESVSVLLERIRTEREGGPRSPNRQHSHHDAPAHPPTTHSTPGNHSS